MIVTAARGHQHDCLLQTTQAYVACACHMVSLCYPDNTNVIAPLVAIYRCYITLCTCQCNSCVQHCLETLYIKVCHIPHSDDVPLDCPAELIGWMQPRVFNTLSHDPPLSPLHQLGQVQQACVRQCGNQEYAHSLHPPLPGPLRSQQTGSRCTTSAQRAGHPAVIWCRSLSCCLLCIPCPSRRAL